MSHDYTRVLATLTNAQRAAVYEWLAADADYYEARHAWSSMWQQPDSPYVCPQCGPAPEGPDAHAARMHTWPPLDA